MPETNLDRHVAQNHEEHVEIVRLVGAGTHATIIVAEEILAALVRAGALTPNGASDAVANIIGRLRQDAGDFRETQTGPDPEETWNLAERLHPVARRLSGLVR